MNEIIQRLSELEARVKALEEAAEAQRKEQIKEETETDYSASVGG